MSERIHVLAQQLFSKSSVDECDLQEIKDLANRHPYFAPVQFLLLEKLKKGNSPDYTSHLQRAVLYYHNPLEFEYFVSSERFETEIDFENEIATGDGQEEESKLSEEVEIPSPAETEKDECEHLLATEDDKSNIIEVEVQDEMQIDSRRAEPLGAEEEDSSTEQDLAAQKMAESIERILNQEEEQIKQPSSSQLNDLVFEPYHTVDYFASQGIKLSQDESGKDKFGKQLKSFTEWLKTMKRLPATQLSQNLDATSESKVQHMAEDSIYKADVVTEAMAEVWIKQGNKEKAIETYNKLGLLNPSKKAYFAGLIENLKRS